MFGINENVNSVEVVKEEVKPVEREKLKVDAKLSSVLENQYYIYGDLYGFDIGSVYSLKCLPGYTMWIAVSEDNYYYITVDFCNPKTEFGGIRDRVDGIIVEKATTIEELVEKISLCKEKISKLSQVLSANNSVVAYKKILEAKNVV